MQVIQESQYLRHFPTKADVNTPHIPVEKRQVTMLEYDNHADVTALIPEILLLETALFGFLKGASFIGNPQCISAMEGIIFYGFEIVKYREVYIPSITMKAIVSAKKFQERISLFYT